MAALAPASVLPAGLGSRLAPRQAARVVVSAPAPRRRVPQPPRALAGALLGGAPSAAGLAVQAASAVAWASALYMAGLLLLQQQSEPDDSSRRECESCGGTGYVECWCNRWSDSDAKGCGTCRGSGRMTCSSCSGGGTAVPIEARIVIRPDERSSNFRRFR